MEPHRISRGQAIKILVPSIISASLLKHFLGLAFSRFCWQYLLSSYMLFDRDKNWENLTDNQFRPYLGKISGGLMTQFGELPAQGNHFAPKRQQPIVL
ncbi:unnamed protein product [Dibothriocephalus latus]|uniref:Uncharacterized protein n=1 Tax=Dibothriocephalus latus TaxID=60516 RepID=A0A3P7LB55_DIBLA|nr:unnamed protein product [Dibothriocephalus latus]